MPISKVDYEKYLRTDAWKAKRQGALTRAEGACQLCAATQNLHVHHRTYDNLGHEPPADLTVLCDRCHQWHHWRQMLRDSAPRAAFDAVRSVQEAMRTFASRTSIARDDLGEIASAKMQALDECRVALMKLDGLDVDPAARMWVRRILVAMIADGVGYSDRMAESLFTPEALAA